MKSAHIIRRARLPDRSGILSLISSHSWAWDERPAKKYFADYFSNPSPQFLANDAVFVFTQREEIIGVIGHTEDTYEGDMYWIGWFYVHKNYQNRGIGRKLLEHMLNELRRKGIRKLFVNTSSDEFYSRALAFYLEEGFRIEAVIKDYYGNGEDQIILSKRFT